MNAPDFKALATMPEREVAVFWFNYWNDLFPVADLKLVLSDEDNRFAGLADYANKTTTFTNRCIDSHAWTFYHVARHEQVHQLLADHGEFSHHTLIFGLVDGALNYHFQKVTKGYKDPKFGITFYDIHEDLNAGDSLNIRVMTLAIKRLSRHTDNIELLIEKAAQYAEWISYCTKSRKPYLNYERKYQLAQTMQEEVFAKWTAADNKYKIDVLELRNEVETLEAAILKKEEALAQAHEKYSALNKLNARWQGALIGLLLLGTWLITRTTT